MRHRPALHSHIHSAWLQQLNANSPALRQRLLRDECELFPRFAKRYVELQALPRRVRRSLERHCKKGLSAIALLLVLGNVPAVAATINVSDTCSLIDAIDSANSGTAVGGCSAGDAAGIDEIVLPANSKIVLTTVNNNPQNPNGLPVISSAINIRGNGSTIRRSAGPATPRFRIFAVDAAGALVLFDTIVSGGRAAATDPERRVGGGIVTLGGTLALVNSTITGNSARYGGGVFNSNDVYGDTTDGGLFLSLFSTISGNTANLGGGGIVNYFSSALLQNSTVSGNSAQIGAGLLQAEGEAELTNVTVTRNTATLGVGGILNAGALTLSQSLISGNVAPGPGKEVFNNQAAPYLGAVTANSFNLFGRNGNSGAYGFTPGVTDVVGSGPLVSILDPNLNFDSGNTLSHALVNGSPAIDAVPSASCATGNDQRTGTRPADGNGDSIADCDIGAVEQGSDPLYCDFRPVTNGCTVNGVVGECRGTSGDDAIIGTAGDDVILGLGGNDVISAGTGNDRICAGPGNDQVNGEAGLDRVFGDAGNDALKGKEDNDALFGGADADSCAGGGGIDSARGCEATAGLP